MLPGAQPRDRFPRCSERRLRVTCETSTLPPSAAHMSVDYCELRSTVDLRAAVVTYLLKVIASPIDPRDQTSEVDDPAYRAYFWDGTGGCDEWELAEADIDEVLDWVRANSRGRRHSLWAVVRSDQDVQLIRLRNIDPTAGPDTWPTWAKEASA